MLPPGKRITLGFRSVIYCNKALFEKSPIQELALLPNNTGDILERMVEASTVTVMPAEAGVAVSFASGGAKVLGCQLSIKNPREVASVGSGGVTTTGIVSTGGGLVPPLLSSSPPISFLQKENNTHTA